ncbi:MAG TPA: pitrilysin family protein [Polyangia bacterium]
MTTLLSEHPFGARLTVRLHRLDNGLQVLLLADRSAPVIAYQTWFSVGSRHEKEGTTGIAHLFEHLMFNQTESHPPGELDRMMESAGGDTNAATWVDWTYYRDNLPREELPLAVELEADRMAHLVLGSDQVESEREVVANERRFRVEDDVDGFLNEELYKRAFEVHPYHWPTIGWMRDIEAISIDDCRAFYKTYYAPNNALVVLVGDFEEAEALALIEARYGKLPAAEIPPDVAPPEPRQAGERRAIFEKPVTADKLRIGYKSPPMPDDDYLALEVLSEILFGGKSSRLEKKLVADTELASSTSASPSPFRDPGLYEISITLQRGHAAEEAERLIYDEIERIKRAPLHPGELETARTRLSTRLWRELRSHAGRAEALGHYHTTCRDYRRLFAVPEALERVSEADIKKVAERYLDEAQRTVLIARPSGEEQS